MPAQNPEKLFEDERHLNREQVLQRFMVPAEHFEGEILPDDIWQKRGQSERALIRPRASFIMPQLRKTYDSVRFQNLGQHICTTGQLQDGAIALHDADHIESYLYDANNYFETDIPVDDIPFHEQFGSFVLTIFGHNRQLGIASYNLKQSGHPDIGTAFEVKVYRNPSFWRVLGMQAAENNGEPPDLWERSRSIVNYEKLRIRDGVPPTNEETAKVFGVDEAQIIKARYYEGLPKEIKELVEAEEMAYSAAIEFKPLSDFYHEKTICELAVRFAKEGRSSKYIERQVKLRIAAIQVSVEVAVYAEEGHLSYSQANDLLKLHKINVPTEEINHWAKIIIRDGYNDAQTTRFVKGLMEEKRKNTHTFWSDPGLSQEQVGGVMTELGFDDGTVHKTVTKLRDVCAGIRAIHSQVDLGFVSAGEIQRIKAADLTEKEIGDILDAIEEGEASGLTEEVLVELSQLMDSFEQVESGQHQNKLADKVAELRQHMQSSVGKTAVQESLSLFA